MDDDREFSKLRQQLLRKQQNVKKLRARLAKQEEQIRENEQYDLQLSKLIPRSMVEDITTDDLAVMVRNTEKFTGVSIYDHEMSSSEFQSSGKVLATDEEFIITAQRSLDDSGARIKNLSVLVKDDDRLNEKLKICCKSINVFMVLNFLKKVGESESAEK